MHKLNQPAFPIGTRIPLESIDELYERQIKPLAPEHRLRLLALMAMDLAAADAHASSDARSLLELEGLGADLWREVDADA